jgi:hypothetical protein
VFFKIFNRYSIFDILHIYFWKHFTLCFNILLFLTFYSVRFLKVCGPEKNLQWPEKHQTFLYYLLLCFSRLMIVKLFIQIWSKILLILYCTDVSLCLCICQNELSDASSQTWVVNLFSPMLWQINGLSYNNVNHTINEISKARALQ